MDQYFTNSIKLSNDNFLNLKKNIYYPSLSYFKRRDEILSKNLSGINITRNRKNITIDSDNLDLTFIK